MTTSFKRTDLKTFFYYRTDLINGLGPMKLLWLILHRIFVYFHSAYFAGEDIALVHMIPFSTPSLRFQAARGPATPNTAVACSYSQHGLVSHKASVVKAKPWRMRKWATTPLPAGHQRQERLTWSVLIQTDTHTNTDIRTHSYTQRCMHTHSCTQMYAHTNTNNLVPDLWKEGEHAS